MPLSIAGDTIGGWTVETATDVDTDMVAIGIVVETAVVIGIVLNANAVGDTEVTDVTAATPDIVPNCLDDEHNAVCRTAGRIGQLEFEKGTERSIVGQGDSICAESTTALIDVIS